MAWTSATRMIVRRRANKLGFTLIELITVITVLVIVSIMIVPNIVSMKATSDRRDAISAIRRMSADARERAIEKGRTTQVAFDESSHELQIQEVADDGTGTTVSHIALPQDLEPAKYQMAGRDSTASDFKLTFGPDGRSNGGGLEFSTFAVSVDMAGDIRFIDGQLPAPEDVRWEAGGLEQRG